MYVLGGRMDKERDGWHLASSSKYDFTAFFDVLSVKRYSEYTPAHSYLLHLEINGKTAIFQTAANACDYVLQRDGRIIEANGDSWGAIDILLAYDPSDIPCDFVIAAASPVILRNSYRCAEVVDEGIHPVELVLSTTAFKKESYIIHNIGLVSKAILGSDEDIAKHSRVYAVDNGRMLGAQKLSGGKVTVSPNRNIDGASGFACGRQGAPLTWP